MLVSRSLAAEVLDKTENIAGATVHYKVILPNAYNPGKAYPAVLAFPGGPQNHGYCRGHCRAELARAARTPGLHRNCTGRAQRPIILRRGGRQSLSGILDQTSRRFQDSGQQVSYCCVVSAVFLVCDWPSGYLPDANLARVHALAKMCINMYAGEMDTAWLEAEKAQAAQFRAQGFIVEFSEEKGQGHVMRTLEGPDAVRLFQAI